VKSPALTSTSPVELTPTAQKLLGQNRFGAFVRQFGNWYVGGVQYGAMYAGIVEIHAQTEEVKREVSASVNAEIGTGTLTVGNSTTVTKTLASFGDRVTTHVVQASIGPAPPQAGSVSAMMATALNFASGINSSNADPLYALLADYTALDVPAGLGDYLEKFDEPEAILEQRQHDLVSVRDRLLKAQAAQAHPEAFADTAQNVRSAVASDLQTLPGVIDAIWTGTRMYLKELKNAVAHDLDPTLVIPGGYTIPPPPTMPPPQPGMAYYVASGTGFALAEAVAGSSLQFSGGPVTYYPAAVLTNADLTQVAQRWILSSEPPESGDMQLTLVNGATKHGVATALISGDGGSQMVAQPVDGESVEWDILARSDGTYVIRLADDHSQNLNALEGTLGGGDNHAGTPVGLYEWGDGKGNEVWLLAPVPPFDPDTGRAG
jgi:hypothetical protein